MAFSAREHMMTLKGKDYLEVKWRIVWFREDHPDYCIETRLMEHHDEHALFEARIMDEKHGLLSMAHGSESKKDFPDYIEKAETKAVGRALALLGYGTQFAADELDEGARIVDAPVERKKAEPKKPEPVMCHACGKEITGYKGNGGKAIPIEDGVKYTREMYGYALCQKCMKVAEAAKKTENKKGGEQ